MNTQQEHIVNDHEHIMNQQERIINNQEHIMNIQHEYIMSTEIPLLNSTGGDDGNETPQWLYNLYNSIAVAMVGFIMLAMGCGIEWPTVKPHLRRPIGPAIGLLCQFLLMPLLCFGMAHAYQLDDTLAIGMVLVGSCPGGVTSNMFTFWCKGDLDLSVTMTVISTVLAILFMPINSYIYTRSWTDAPAVIPYVNMVIGIILTWIPVLVGMAIRKKWKGFAKQFLKIGSLVGFGLLCFNGLVQRYAYPEVFSLPWIVWFAAITQPLFGMTMGFLIAWACKRELKQRRTIGLETGMQNVGLALALIALSYDGPDASVLSQYPILYAALSITDATIISIAHRSYYRAVGKRTVCQTCYYGYQSNKQKQMNSTSSTADLVAADIRPVDGSSYDLSIWENDNSTEDVKVGIDRDGNEWDLGSGINNEGGFDVDTEEMVNTDKNHI